MQAWAPTRTKTGDRACRTKHMAIEKKKSVTIGRKPKNNLGHQVSKEGRKRVTGEVHEPSDAELKKRRGPNRVREESYIAGRFGEYRVNPQPGN